MLHSIIITQSRRCNNGYKPLDLGTFIKRIRNLMILMLALEFCSTPMVFISSIKFQHYLIGVMTCDFLSNFDIATINREQVRLIPQPTKCVGYNA